MSSISLRESSLTLDRVYATLAEFLIELKLHEEQDKIAQIVTGSSSTGKHSMFAEYISASKGKVPAKGKGKQSDGKGTKSTWRPACDDYWKPGGCSARTQLPEVSSLSDSQADVRYVRIYQAFHLSMFSPSQAQSKNVEWEGPLGLTKTKNGMTINGSLRRMKRPKARKVKEKDLSQRGSLRPRMLQDRLLQDLHSLHRRRRPTPSQSQTRSTLMHDK